MGKESSRKADWVFLPKNAQKISLLGCLHDGELISCRSNLFERIVTLEFSVNYLPENKEKPITFLLKLDEVSSVRAIGYFHSVGKIKEPENLSLEERKQFIVDHWNWRAESFNWSEFETALATDPLQITDASYATNEITTTLKLGGFLNGEKFDNIYFDVFLRGKTLTASRSDGEDFSLETFIGLGKDYWNAFGNK